MSRKRILFVGLGSLGDIYPLLAIGRAAQAAGHHVTIATLERHERAVCRAGLNFSRAQSDWVVGSEQDPLRRAFLDTDNCVKILMLDFVLSHLEESVSLSISLIKSHDVLVLGTGSVGARLAAEKLNRRWTTIYLSPFQIGSHIKPSLQIEAPALRSASAEERSKFFQSLGRPWHEMRRKLRLPFKSAAEATHSPLPPLALFPSDFASDPGDWPRELKIMGFCQYDEAPDAGEFGRAQDFLARGTPPVVVTAGSHSQSIQSQFFERSISAARRLGLRTLVVGRDATYLEHSPGPDVACFKYLPYGCIFPHASVVVSHSGMGTISHILAAGRPFLAVPSLVMDQPDNAVRSRRLGIAEVIPLPSYSADRAAIALARLLGNPGYSEAAQRTALGMARFGDGSERAASFLVDANEDGRGLTIGKVDPPPPSPRRNASGD